MLSFIILCVLIFLIIYGGIYLSTILFPDKKKPKNKYDYFNNKW